MKKVKFATMQKKCFSEFTSFLKRERIGFVIQETHFCTFEGEEITKSIHVLGLDTDIEISERPKEIRVCSSDSNLFTRIKFENIAEKDAADFVTDVTKLLETFLASARAISDAKKNIWRAEERFTERFMF